jgi:hypothetical protein
VNEMADSNATAGTTGRVLHAAASYDLLVWLFTLGREAYRFSTWRALSQESPS